MTTRGGHADQRTKGKRLGIAAALTIVSQLLSLAIGLVTTPLLVRRLGDVGYGMLAIVAAFTSYFAYLELGIGTAYLREMAAAFAVNDSERAQRHFETAHVVYLTVAAAGALLMLLIGLPWIGTTGIDRRVLLEGRLGLLVTAATFATTMALSTTRGVVFSAQRVDLYSRVSLVLQPLIPLGQAAAVLAGRGLVTVLLIQGAGNVAIDVVMYWLARRLHPELQLRLRFHRDVWAGLWRFSAYKFVAQLAQQGQYTADRLLVGTLLGSSAVAPYAVAASVAQRLRSLASAFAGPFIAAAVDRYSTDGAAGLAGLMRSYVGRVAALVSLATAGGAFLARPFLQAWLGEPYASEGAPILVILIVTTAVLVLGGLTAFATDAVGRPSVGAWSSGIGLAISLALGAVLVGRMGAVGAAWSFAAGGAVQLVWAAIGLAQVVGIDEALSLSGSCLVLPAAVGVVAYGAMTALPSGVALAGALPAALAGTAAGLGAAIAVGLHRPRV
jgi:O-antigen/teichoic acid export membrane protein